MDVAINRASWPVELIGLYRNFVRGESTIHECVHAAPFTCHCTGVTNAVELGGVAAGVGQRVADA